jgi:peptidoglycan hydrolase-like protein with peptidoglycan-binding domain
MSANRTSWIVAGLVVLVVGFLVVRTLRNDTATRAPVHSEARAADPATEARMARARARRDSIAQIPPAERLSSIQRAKQVLKAGGFYDGPMDGNFDDRLTQALKKFQASKGMKPTGYLDHKTYEAMGIELRPRER